MPLQLEEMTRTTSEPARSCTQDKGGVAVKKREGRKPSSQQSKSTNTPAESETVDEASSTTVSTTKTEVEHSASSSNDNDTKPKNNSHSRRRSISMPAPRGRLKEKELKRELSPVRRSSRQRNRTAEQHLVCERIDMRGVLLVVLTAYDFSPCGITALHLPCLHSETSHSTRLSHVPFLVCPLLLLFPHTPPLPTSPYRLLSGSSRFCVPLVCLASHLSA